MSRVVAGASSDGGPTSGPLIALTLYVYLVSGSRPVCEYDLAELPVSILAVSKLPASPFLNSILYPVTDDPPLEPGSLHVRSIRSCDAADALTLPGLPGGFFATVVFSPAADPLPDSSVSVIVTVSDLGVSPKLSFAFTAKLCSRSVSSPVMVYDVCLPPVLSCLAGTPLLKIFNISNCVMVWPCVPDGGSQSRRALVGDSAVMLTWVGAFVSAGFSKPVAPDGVPRPTSLRAVTLYE